MMYCRDWAVLCHPDTNQTLGAGQQRLIRPSCSTDLIFSKCAVQHASTMIPTHHNWLFPRQTQSWRPDPDAMVLPQAHKNIQLGCGGFLGEPRIAGPASVWEYQQWSWKKRMEGERPLWRLRPSGGWQLFALIHCSDLQSLDCRLAHVFWISAARALLPVK